MMRDLSVNIESLRFPGSSDDILRDFTLRVPAGRFISILGPSGCGKTTLLRIIAGLEPRAIADVRLGDDHFKRPGRSVQLVFQDTRLVPWMRVKENVAFALPESDPEGERQQLLRTIRGMGLSNRERAWPSELSGGEQSRVALARALVTTPVVLLLDEPFKTLDIVTKLSVIRELSSWLDANPITVLMASHNVDDAVLLSDEILLVGNRPLQVQRSFPVVLERPRFQRSQAVVQLTKTIYDAILSCENEKRNRPNP
jgi:ABC-type nitrate/sulfonate/bicarbonate transport system ATPase subunit